jgi:serine/threonine-protein kinase
MLTIALLAPPSWSQSTSDKVAAEGLFDQGRSAMQRGDFTQACGLLERSQRIDPAVGTLLYLAECYEKSGRTASAWATFREAADAADAAHESARARTGRDRATRLEPQLARLTIQLAPENEQIANISVELGGQAVQVATWNVSVPVDPGDHQISVSAPGYEAWTSTVTVPPRAANVSVPVPPLKKNAEAEKAPGAAPVEGAPTATPPQGAVESRVDIASSMPAPAADRGAASQKTAAYVLGGVGIVGIGVGSFFGLKAISKAKDAQSFCPNGLQCIDNQGVTLSDDARSAALVSDITFALGAAALVGGVVLYLTAPSSPSGDPPTPSTALRARVRPNGVSLEGSF